MKKYIKRIFLPLILVSVMTLSGCSLFSKKKDKELDVFKYSFANYDKNYLVNENFSFDGMILELIYEDGTVKKITITENMIVSKPDMSTPGTKVVVVKYDGEEYKFEIIVEEKNVIDEEVLVNKLKDFLDNYTGSNDSLMMNVNADVIVKYLEQAATLEDYQIEVLLKDVLSTGELSSEVYDAIFDAIVNGSFNLGKDSILDVEGMKAAFDKIAFLDELSAKLNDINWSKYFINYLIPSECDEEVVSDIVEYLTTGFDLNDEGKEKLNDLVESSYYDLKEGEIAPIEEVVADLIDIIRTYTNNSKIKDIVNAVIDFDTTDLKSQLSEIIELILKHKLKIMTIDAYAEYYSTYAEDFIDTPVAQDIINGTINKTILVFESIYDVYESLRFNNADDIKNLIVEALSSLKDGSEFMSTVMGVLEQEEWLLVSGEYPIMEGIYYCHRQGTEPEICRFEPDYSGTKENYQELKEEYEELEAEFTANGFIGLWDYFGLSTGNYEIDTIIYSLIASLENNESFLSIFLDEVFVEEDLYYVEKITDWLSQKGKIESNLGKIELTEVIEKYFEDFKNVSDFSIEDALVDIIEVIGDYTVSDEIKNTINKLETRDLEKIKNIVSDIAYIQMAADSKIITVENFEHLLNHEEYVFETSSDAKTLIERYAVLESEKIKVEEEALFDLLSVRNFGDLVSVFRDYYTGLKENYLEEKSILEILEANELLICSSDEDDNYSYSYIEYQDDWTWDEDNYQWIQYIYYVDYGIDDIDNNLHTLDLALDIVDVISNLENDFDGILSDVLASESNLLFMEELIDNLFNEEDDYYVDAIVEALSIVGQVDSLIGKNHLTDVVTKYFDDLRNSYKLSVEDALVDILEVIKDYTSSDEIKTTIKTLETRDIEEVKNILSDIIYVDTINNFRIMTLENYQKYYNDYNSADDVFSIDDPIFETSIEAKKLMERYARVSSDEVEIIEEFLYEILTLRNFTDLENSIENFYRRVESYFSELTEIYKILETNEWVVVSEVENYIYLEMSSGMELVYDPVREQSVAVIHVYYDVEDLEDSRDSATEKLEKVELFFDSIKNPYETFIDLVEENRSDILDSINEFIEKEVANEELVEELKILVEDSIDDVINKELSVEELINQAMDLVYEYVNEDIKVTLDALGVLFTVLNYDPEIDYNEVFKNLPLPEEIELIDYNKLLAAILDENTYDLLNITDWTIDYITNDQQEIVGEVLTLKINIDFDAVIASIKGNVKLEIKLDF